MRDLEEKLLMLALAVLSQTFVKPIVIPVLFIIVIFFYVQNHSLQAKLNDSEGKCKDSEGKRKDSEGKLKDSESKVEDLVKESDSLKVQNRESKKARKVRTEDRLQH